MADTSIDSTIRTATRVRVEGDLFHGRVPDGAIYIGRSAPGLLQSAFHNPFKAGKTIAVDTPADAVAMYEDWFTYGATAPYPHHGETRKLEALREEVFNRIADGEPTGRDLACWCQLGAPCHGDVLLKLVVEIAVGAVA